MANLITSRSSSDNSSVISWSLASRVKLTLIGPRLLPVFGRNGKISLAMTRSSAVGIGPVETRTRLPARTAYPQSLRFQDGRAAASPLMTLAKLSQRHTAFLPNPDGYVPHEGAGNGHS